MSGADAGRAVLELRGVSVAFPGDAGSVHAVDEVDLSVRAGQVLGLVGESGCGKSTLARAAMGLLPPGATMGGGVLVNGQETATLDEEGRRRLRGATMSMVLQDPSTSLDPTAGIGGQVAETVRAHHRVSARRARALALAQLEEVGIADAAARYRDPPHRFSGGMRQRVVIAAALVNDPQVLIADEPTTALDVTVQAQVLALMRRLCTERGTGVLLVTHDLAVVAQVCDHVAVMYAGQVVETAPAAELFTAPRHPYTQALLSALPSSGVAHGELAVIEGTVPDLVDPPPGCRFADRCPSRMTVCDLPPPRVRVDSSEVTCWLHVPAGDRPLVPPVAAAVSSTPEPSPGQSPPGAR